MRVILASIMWLFLIVVFDSNINGQVPVSEIMGRLELYHTIDTNSMLLGYRAGVTTDLNSGEMNRTFIGSKSGENSSSRYSTYIGYKSGRSTIGSDNVSIGESSGEYSLGSDNVFVGFYSGVLNQGNKNTSVGANSGPIYEPYFSDGGEENTTVGFASGNGTNSGKYNTFLGSRSGNANRGDYNVAIGYRANNLSTDSSHNVSVGSNTLREISSGFNTAVGDSSMYNVDANSFIFFDYGNNVAVGASSLYSMLGTATNSVAIGYQAGYEGGLNSVFIGYQSGKGIVDISNRLYISNRPGDPLLYGEFDNEILQTNGVHRFNRSQQHQLEIINEGPGSQVWRLGSSSNNWNAGGGKFLINNSTNSSNASLTIDSSGNVGIGLVDPDATLHIKDVMKLEPTPTEPNCSQSEDIGQIYYNSNRNRLRVCTMLNGSSNTYPGWKDLHDNAPD